MWDVIVVGAGPAGVAVAAQVARRGREVLCVAPRPFDPWPNSYGDWADELDASGYAGVSASTWSRARVRLDDGIERVFDRAYVRIDNARLRARLEAEGEDRLRFLEGEVQSVLHSTSGSTLLLEGGRTIEARLVVDASGRGVLLDRAPVDARPVAAQVAYGVELEGPHRVPLHEMLFMDLSPVGDDALPTFLYAMPLGPGRVFVEETVLVARPPPAPEELEARLELRLTALARFGLNGLRRVGPVERCFIPMGGPIPRGPQRVVPFGAAAGMVHPATGYQLTRALGDAGPLADALVHGLTHAPEHPRLAAELGWTAVWSPARRRQWEVFRFGMEVLLTLDAAQTRAFFEAFFDLAPDVWARYLSGRGTGAEVARAMGAVFVRLPWRLRSRIVAACARRPGLDLLRGLA